MNDDGHSWNFRPNLIEECAKCGCWRAPSSDTIWRPYLREGNYGPWYPRSIGTCDEELVYQIIES